LLPADRRFAFSITDGRGVDAALASEMLHIGAPAPSGATLPERLVDAIHNTRARLKGAHVIEVGIGCESCHGGSVEHVRDPQVAPSFAPRAAFLRAGPVGPRPVSRAEWINRTCARCHQVLFSRYPYTWEGGHRRGDPGGSSINSGEARDFLLGGCASQMACTTCHDPHAADEPARLAELATPAGNAVCTRCHPSLASAAALRAHAHHDPTGPGGACIACHMPRKNTGLGYQLTRYHRIGSPTDRVRVEGDRPIECALCHPARSVADLVGDLDRLWGKHFERAALERLYGPDLSRPLLAATVERGKPHEQIAAMMALAEQWDRSAGSLRLIMAELTHPYPLVRLYARRALEIATGTACPVDVNAGDDDIRAQAERWIGSLVLAQSPRAR
jgi:predicted CXXCH cytochrome family protein